MEILFITIAKMIFSPNNIFACKMNNTSRCDNYQDCGCVCHFKQNCYKCGKLTIQELYYQPFILQGNILEEIIPSQLVCKECSEQLAEKCFECKDPCFKSESYYCLDCRKPFHRQCRTQNSIIIRDCRNCYLQECKNNSRCHKHKNDNRCSSCAKRNNQEREINKRKLINTLKTHGLELRDDSVMCARYINGHTKNLDKVIKKMCWSKLIHEYCDWNYFLNQVQENQKINENKRSSAVLVEEKILKWLPIHHQNDKPWLNNISVRRWRLALRFENLIGSFYNYWTETVTYSAF